MVRLRLPQQPHRDPLASRRSQAARGRERVEDRRIESRCEREARRGRRTARRRMRPVAVPPRRPPRARPTPSVPPPRHSRWWVGGEPWRPRAVSAARRRCSAGWPVTRPRRSPCRPWSVRSSSSPPRSIPPPGARALHAVRGGRCRRSGGWGVPTARARRPRALLVDDDTTTSSLHAQRPLGPDRGSAADASAPSSCGQAREGAHEHRNQDLEGIAVKSDRLRTLRVPPPSPPRSPTRASPPAFWSV
jgi:hypothetical protein